MTRRVVFSPEAEADLDDMLAYIAVQSDAERAFGYATRIVDYCESLVQFPERGSRRDDLRPGLRIVGFERRVVIAFHVTPDTVSIDRILYGGRDLLSALSEQGKGSRPPAHPRSFGIPRPPS